MNIHEQYWILIGWQLIINLRITIDSRRLTDITYSHLRFSLSRICRINYIIYGSCISTGVKNQFWTFHILQIMDHQFVDKLKIWNVSFICELCFYVKVINTEKVSFLWKNKRDESYKKTIPRSKWIILHKK